jgi:hypothetical protein
MCSVSAVMRNCIISFLTTLFGTYYKPVAWHQPTNTNQRRTTTIQTVRSWTHKSLIWKTACSWSDDISSTWQDLCACREVSGIYLLKKRVKQSSLVQSVEAVESSQVARSCEATRSRAASIQQGSKQVVCILAVNVHQSWRGCFIDLLQVFIKKKI